IAVAKPPIAVAAPPPTARDDTAATDKNTAITIDVLANDSASGDALDPAVLKIVAVPAHGQAFAQNGAIRYTPAHDFVGQDSLNYQICPQQGACSQARVMIDVKNKPPIAADDRAQTNQNEAIAIDALGNDRDPDGTLVPSSVTILGQPSHGLA